MALICISLLLFIVIVNVGGEPSTSDLSLKYSGNSKISQLPVIPKLFYKCEKKDDFLVTLDVKELSEIVSYIVESKDKKLQRRLYKCEEKKPRKVLESLRGCYSRHIGFYRDYYYEMIEETPEKISEIYKCVKEDSTPLTLKEKRKMVDFEDCIRKLSKDVRHHIDPELWRSIDLSEFDL